MADDVNARVRVTCVRCGTVDVAIALARLTSPAEGGGGATVEVDCPRCGATTVTAVDSRTAGLLLRADVSVHAPTGTLGRSPAPGDHRA